VIIHILEEPATAEKITEMLQAHRFYVKTVVDIRRQILAGGGEMHFDCETVLLDHGSQQEDLWGASWNPISQEIVYDIDGESPPASKSINANFRCRHSRSR
jgi:Protein of unknown function (DUF5674)